MVIWDPTGRAEPRYPVEIPLERVAVSVVIIVIIVAVG